MDSADQGLGPGQAAQRQRLPAYRRRGSTARARSARPTPADRAAWPGGASGRRRRLAGVTISSPGRVETDLGRTRRARRIGRALTEAHPDAHCELDHSSALELAVATILSAQCTDKKVNEVTPKLFARYPTAADYAGADRAELEELIRPTGFYRNKTDSLIKLGQALIERHDGRVPGRLADLVTLPGIGRKTANVILGNAFDVPGITVDTHFQRLVQRWGLTIRDRPRQDRTRDRGDLSEARLDHALAPDHLPRPAGLPRPQARLRGVHPGPALPVVRRSGRPSRPPPQSCSRAPAPGSSRSPPGSTRSWCRPRPSSRRHRETSVRRAARPGAAGPRRLHRHRRAGARRHRPRRAPRPSPFADCATLADPPAPAHRPPAPPGVAPSGPAAPTGSAGAADSGGTGSSPAPAGGGGSRLPELVLSCFTGGAPVTLRDIQGPAVINVWASWCPPCRQELPAFQRLSVRAAGQLQVIGVNSRDSRDGAQAIGEDFGIRVPGPLRPGRGPATGAAPHGRPADPACRRAGPGPAHRHLRRARRRPPRRAGPPAPRPGGARVTAGGPAGGRPAVGAARQVRSPERRARRPGSTRCWPGSAPPAPRTSPGWPPPRSGGRESAVLVLLGEQPGAGPDVLVLQRAATLRNHAGQPAFPGGAADPEDADVRGHRAARGERGGRSRPGQRDRPGRAAEALDPGQRLRGHPGAGLVAQPAPGAPPGTGRGGARRPAAGRRAGRPGQPDAGPPLRAAGSARRSRVARDAGLGLHRRSARRPAGDGRLGPPVAARRGWSSCRRPGPPRPRRPAPRKPTNWPVR